MLGADLILLEGLRILQRYQRDKAWRKKKVRIYKANTPRAFIVHPYPLHNSVRAGLADYVDELKQQAKWDVEKCANQQ